MAAPPTSASGSATWACARCWSARSARTSPSTARGWSATTSTATRCTSPRPATPPASCAPTTRAHAQIASFYAGAMSEAREIELKPIVDRVGEPDYVLIGPDDPQGMLRHTEECRQRGYRFVADPSQQLAFGDGDLIRPLIDGADILFSNEYEASLITQKTGWSREEILSRVGTWVVTLGAGRASGSTARARSRSSSPPSPRSRRSSRPASATRSGPASSPPSPGASATSAPPSSAACWRSTSSSRSAPRSTRSPAPPSSSAARRPTATRPRPTSSRTCARSAPDLPTSRRQVRRRTT